MIKLFLLSALISLHAQAIEVTSYRALSPELKQAWGFLNEKDIAADKSEQACLSDDLLINQNITKDWKKPDACKQLDTVKRMRLQNYAEGTGTRGGGSGLVVNSRLRTEVKLLEIFRSENLSTYKLFFPIDDELRKIENQKTADEATVAIFEKVMSRLQSVAPNLAAKINVLYRSELPFRKWTPVYDDLSLIEDELKYPPEPNTQKVQIASRRTHFIMYNVRAYSAMDPLNRAALWLHEYIYALSGTENSIKTQRAVSLFFSSQFLEIAQDIPRLTQLFYEMGLLSISRKSLAGSLPPGSHVTDTRQTENCGTLEKIDMSAGADRIIIQMDFGISKKRFELTRAQATLIMSALVWAKAFLTTDFPIYKYYGQKIMPDRFCFDRTFAKVIQIQSALAIDDDLALATEKDAATEVAKYIAKSNLIEAADRNADPIEMIKLLDEMTEKATEHVAAHSNFFRASLTPIEKMKSPKILREYSVTIED